MGVSTIGFVLTTLGELLIGYTVFRVHTKVSREHKIDDKVVREIKKERKITLLGLVLIVIGFFLQFPYK